MRLSRKIVAIIIVGMTISAAHAQVQVTVLAVNETTANTSSAAAQMAEIASVLANTGIEVSVNYANFGFPVQLNANVGGSNNEEIRTNLRDNTNLMSIRNAYHADLVFVFVDQLVFGYCGYAPSIDWFGGNGMTPQLGPDTRGSETHFIGLISTESDCRSETYLGAHEFGHLFGGAHEVTAGTGPGLHFNTYADLEEGTGGPFFFEIGSCTVMATLGIGPNTCPLPCSASTCAQIPKFSNSLTVTSPPGTNAYRVSEAIEDTSYSVSIYRVQQPVCSLTTPVAVHGEIVNPCDPEPWTSHDLFWTDLCEEASNRYEIWAQQPATGGTGGYSYRWTIGEPLTSDRFYVIGDSSNMKVKACTGSSTCTWLSFTKYNAEWIGECY